MNKKYTIDFHSSTLVGTAKDIKQAKQFAKDWSIYGMTIVHDVREATEEDIAYYAKNGGVIEELN